MNPKCITSIVGHGDRIPFDGKVVDGFAIVDESAETGVSTPVILEPVQGHDNAIAGTLLMEGWLRIESPLDARCIGTGRPLKQGGRNPFLLLVHRLMARRKH